MTLDELIAALEAADPNLVVPHGFARPHSFRGYYHQLAFEPARIVTVASMLADARKAHGSTYEGWKGGDYFMDGDTDCWLAHEGCSSDDQITPTLLQFMLAAGTAPTPAQAASEAAIRTRLLAELFDQAEDGDIPGTVIRHDGHEVWIHTTGQVTGWLHTLQEQAAKETQ